MVTSALSPAPLNLDALPSGSLGEELTARAREIDRLQAEMVALSHRFKRSREWEAEGWQGPIAWIASRCRVSRAAAAELVGMGERLCRLPLTEAALLAGEIGFRHAALLYHLAEVAGYEPVLPMEAQLVAQARELSPDRFARLLRHFRGMLDPDGSLEEARLAHESRYLDLAATIDGVYHLKGKFDPDAGAVIEAALLAVTPERNQEDERSPGNRRADGLLDICRTVLDGGRLPEVAGEKPHVTLTVSAEFLAGRAGAMPATIGDDIPVPVETAQRLMCDSLITPMTVSPSGRPLNMGRTRRTVTARQRRALDARDRGCRFPGCERPWWWTDAHHIRPWEKGGSSDLDNLILLCRHHHVCVHEGGWVIAWTQDHSGFVVVPPRS